MDAITLEPLKVFIPPHSYTQLLAFSPEGGVLTWVGPKSGPIISWDLQTGIQVGESLIEQESNICVLSITHSKCETMLGVLFKIMDDNTIATNTYNILSGELIYHHLIVGAVTGVVWTHDEHLQITTVGLGFITLWETGFSSTHPPTEIESLCTPNYFYSSTEFVFLPTLFRVAFIIGGSVLVWDIQYSMPLLTSTSINWPRNMAFSSNGHFFACGADGPEIYLWKESPTGYLPHQKLISSSLSYSKMVLSPNGISIIGFAPSHSILQLWHTKNSTTSTSDVPASASWHVGTFILGFSPDRSLVVTARRDTPTARVLDLRSGVTQLIIDTGMRIYGLSITGSSVIVVGDGKIITWNMPTGDHVPNARVNINNSAQRVKFNFSAPLKLVWMDTALISPDFSYLVIRGKRAGEDVSIVEGGGLNIYDVSTGKHLAGVPLPGSELFFTPDGHEVWCQHAEGCEGWAIVKDIGSDTTKLECLDPTRSPSGGLPWQSSYGYQVTADGWMLNPSGRRLLWLPYHWRSTGWGDRIWSGQFLAFLHCGLLDTVILELPKE